MSKLGRLLSAFALVLHIAVPAMAYVHWTAEPDFGALCSVQALIPGEASRNAPIKGGHGNHVVHCPLCGGAACAAIPTSAILASVSLSVADESIAAATESTPFRVLATPNARGPPLLIRP